MARTHPGWFGKDGVHPSMAGYRARAAATARLVQSCGRVVAASGLRGA